jgi:hypothetical protein
MINGRIMWSITHPTEHGTISVYEHIPDTITRGQMWHRHLHVIDISGWMIINRVVDTTTRSTIGFTLHFMTSTNSVRSTTLRTLDRLGRMVLSCSLWAGYAELTGIPFDRSRVYLLRAETLYFIDTHSSAVLSLSRRTDNASEEMEPTTLPSAEHLDRRTPPCFQTSSHSTTVIGNIHQHRLVRSSRLPEHIDLSGDGNRNLQSDCVSYSQPQSTAFRGSYIHKLSSGFFSLWFSTPRVWFSTPSGVWFRRWNYMGGPSDII